MSPSPLPIPATNLPSRWAIVTHSIQLSGPGGLHAETRLSALLERFERIPDRRRNIGWRAAGAAVGRKIVRRGQSVVEIWQVLEVRIVATTDQAAVSWTRRFVRIRLSRRDTCICVTPKSEAIWD